MSETEVVGLLNMLRTAYPRFYVDTTQEEVINVVKLWHEMFKNDSREDVLRATKELICELKYPPVIADIKQKIDLYERDRQLEKHAKLLENEEKERMLMLKKRQKALPTAEKKVNASEYVKNIKKIILGGQN